MVRVFEIATGITFAPAERLRMLWGHPYLQLQGTGTSFRLTMECIDRQKRILRNVFDIAKSAASQFVVFPEFSLPIEMVSETDDAVSSAEWPEFGIC